MRTPLLLACAATLLLAQSPSLKPVQFESQPALLIANDKLQLTVSVLGASFARLTLSDDPTALNPLWEPGRMARELGQATEFRGGTGHFVCVDGFGPVSPEEKAAGLPGHGEAHVQIYELTDYRSSGNSITATLTANLPIVQERFTRTISMVNGESVVYVNSRLENLLGFDRPVNWAEHATVGSPFLASGDTVVDLSGTRSQTRPYDQVQFGQSQRRLLSGRDFTWPIAPTLDGSSVDLRQTPRDPHYLDHATTLVDPSAKYGWVTALNIPRNLVFGYVFRRADFPWIQYWGNYPPTSKMSRGLEFSTQPYDVSRREAMETHSMFGAPTYRWLPAQSTIDSSFLFFYAHTPSGLRRIDDLRFDGGKLVLEDRTSHTTLTLAASRTL